jgi:hypothetical protein
MCICWFDYVSLNVLQTMNICSERLHVSTEMQLSFISKQNDSGVSFLIIQPVRVPVHNISPCFAICVVYYRTALHAMQQQMMATLPFAVQVEPTIFLDISPTLHQLSLVFPPHLYFACSPRSTL